jgi:sarcosine oxidase subunit beta
LEDELDADIGYRRHGNLMLAENDATANRLAEFVERQHRNGLTDVMLLDRDQVRELVPGIAAQVVAGSYRRADGQADPVLTMRAFAWAAQRAGAEYRTGVRCDALTVEDRRLVGAKTSRGDIAAETTILAAGAWSIKPAAAVGLALPLRIEALQMIRSTPARPTSPIPVLSSLDRSLSLKQLPSGAFLLGGGWPGDLTDDGDGYRMRQESLDGKLARSMRHPSCRCRVSDRSRMVRARGDNLPMVGRVAQLDGIILATGFSGHGFAIAPAIGRAVADLIEGKTVAELEGLRPDRFANQGILWTSKPRSLA